MRLIVLSIGMLGVATFFLAHGVASTAETTLVDVYARTQCQDAMISSVPTFDPADCPQFQGRR